MLALTASLLFAGCESSRSTLGRNSDAESVGLHGRSGHSVAPIGSKGSEIDPATDRSWLASVRRGLAEREYEATPNGVGLQAPNRRHNLRTYFEPTGIRVHDRTAAGSPQLVGLSLVGLGRGSALSEVEPGVVDRTGNRVEIERAGVLEWYENSEAGLEQGFDLRARPDGEGELTIELAVTSARASLAGERVLLATTAGRKLAYEKLVVVDAGGRRLAARLEVPDEERVRIVVADAGARYPIAIDPILTETADAQLAGDQLGARLGISVSDAGDVNGDGYADVIVGAHAYDAGEVREGAAFVFLGSASGIANGTPASAAARLESNQVDAALGFSVSSAGDVNGDGYDDVIVGAAEHDAILLLDGAAFVFLGSASGIANGTALTAATSLIGSQANEGFGVSVSGAGDVNGDGYDDVIVGGELYSSGEAYEGAAFVFLGSASGIASGNDTTASARMESNQANAMLGYSVSGAGDVNGDGYADVIVGAREYDSGESKEGAAFILLGSASGIANSTPATASVRLESNQSAAFFGTAVSDAGDVNGDGYSDVIVGSLLYSSGEINEGAAFIFLGSASVPANWSAETASTRIESDQQNALLGYSVSGAGDVNGDGYADVIVGAPRYGSGEVEEGAAFVFLGSASGIANAAPATAAARLESNQAGANLGQSVSGAGDVDGDGYADVILGAPVYDTSVFNGGAAFVYHGGSSGVADGNPDTASALHQSNQPNAEFAVSVAGAGDVNGDGYADAIVGADRFDSGETDEGAAFLFLGSSSGVPAGSPVSAATRLESNQANAHFGWSVGSAGDVNGDGYADVIIGAPQYDAGETDEGAAFVFLGRAAGIPDGGPGSAWGQLESNQNSAFFGTSVAGAGDTNGDGHAEVIVGANLYDAGEVNEGAAFVFRGRPGGVLRGTPATAMARIESNASSSELGVSVAGAGDVNGDGYADVIVGAHLYGANQQGLALVSLGGPSGIANGNPATLSATDIPSFQAFGWLGYRVAGAGDVDGDGFDDVIVGAPLFDFGETDEGIAAVIPGAASGLSGSVDVIQSNQANGLLGWSVAGVGDVNGDGYADVLVGAPTYDAGESNEGAAFLHLGSEAGTLDGDPTTAAATLQGDEANAQLGTSVAGLGDANGDGFADVIVGAPYSSRGESLEGASFVYLGNGGASGRPVLARQLRADDSGHPVQAWGRSANPDGFAIRMQATHPEGRGNVKLQVEACPPGVAFGDGLCTQRTSLLWDNLRTTPSGERELQSFVSGLPLGQLYRWRARILHWSSTTTRAQISAPPQPAHGPWRRVTAQAFTGDVRVVPEPGRIAMLMAGLLGLGALFRSGRARGV